MSAGQAGGLRSAWLVGYALATFLAFPHPVAGRVLDLGLVAAWVAPACLLLGLRGLGPRAAARSAFLAGWAAHAAIFHWIYVVTVRYGHAPPVVGVLAPIGLALYPAAFSAAFGAVVGWTARPARPGGGAVLPSPFAVAAAWAALDHGKSWALTGFPWALLGYAQHQNPALLGLAPWTGVYGLSFATALGGAGLAGLAAARLDDQRAPREAWLALAGVALLLGAGGLDRLLADGEPAGHVRVAVLQGDIEQGVKWSPAWAERTLEIYEDMTRRAAAAGAAVVLWPETAVPGSPDYDPDLAGRLADLARETRTTLVVGAVGLDFQGKRRHFYDSAYVWDARGRRLARYDKAHLVPFGEYLPFRPLLGHFIEAIATGAADTDVSPGTGPRAVVLPFAAGAAGPPGGMTVGIPICYELLFPDLVRRFVQDGAEALLAITNDAWYGRTGAPYQFLAITALRSAENRVWIARAANTGVSAFIDDHGRVREATPIFERTWRMADVELRPPPAGGSFYTRHGDWFAAGCWAAAAAALAAAVRRRRRGPGARGSETEAG